MKVYVDYFYFTEENDDAEKEIFDDNTTHWLSN